MQQLGHHYHRLADRGAHGALLLFCAFVILLVPGGGVAGSALMAIVVLAGLSTLVLDPEARAALVRSPELRWLGALLALVLLWQSLGLALRDPPDRKAGEGLAHALSIASILPVLVAALIRDRDFVHSLLRALFVMACCAAALSLARHVYWSVQAQGGLSAAGLLANRLLPIGRASHEIFGAGGLAAGAFAGLALWPQARNRLLQGAGIILILAAIVLTQSRGPILAFGTATLAATAIGAMRGPRARWLSLLAVVICFAIPVAMILTEPWLKSLLCSDEGGFCRPSARQDVWFASAALVADKPWFGVGPGFRFAAGTVPHPHNGLLGLTVFFGLPAATLFAGIVALAVTRAAAAGAGPARHFALAGAFFSAGFLGTDLANPFGYLNTHYLYLWLPLMLGTCLAGSLVGTAEPRPLRAPSGPDPRAATHFARSSQRG